MDKHRKQNPLRWVLAQNIRLARISRGWSQEKLAERSNLHRTYIGSVERGEISIGIDTLGRIAAAFDMTASTLIDGAIPAGPFYINELKPRP